MPFPFSNESARTMGKHERRLSKNNNIIFYGCDGGSTHASVETLLEV